MKLRWFGYFLIFLLLLPVASCDNKPDSGQGTDGIHEESPDVNHKDDDGKFITAGSQSSGEDNAGGSSGGGEGADNETPIGDEDDKGDYDSAQREIVEADIYKVEGDTIWVLNRYRGLIAIDFTDPSNMKITDKISFKGMPFEMYFQEGRAYIMVRNVSVETVDDEEGYSRDWEKSRLYVIDTSDRTDLKMMNSFDMAGNIVDSRQVGDVLYVVSSERSYYWYYCDEREQRGKDQLTIMSVNITDPQNIKLVQKASIDGTGHAVYVSQKSIYIAEYNYYWEDGNEESYPVHMFDISDPAGAIIKRDTFSTDGYVGDRWKMYEKGDVFFAVSSTSRWGNATSIIESFDISDPDNITQIQKLPFMEEQELYATRFEDDRMYAVTYFRTDPLHVIDIADPAQMSQLGELWIPGWSTHIEIRGSKLIAVGVDDEGNRATKVSMYDVENPAEPVEMSMVELSVKGGYSSSEANRDWKAFKVWDALGLILVPTVEYDHSRYYRRTNYLHFIDFDLETGLKKRGYITSEGEIRRGVVAGDYIASIGEREVLLIDAADRDNPEILSRMTLAYRVDNINKCGDKLCGLFGGDWGEPVRLAVFDTASKESPVTWLSESSYEDSYRLTLMINNDMGYLFSRDRGYYYDENGSYVEEDGFYTVDVYSFKGAGDPQFKGRFKLEAPTEEKYHNYYHNASFNFTENNVVGMVLGWETYYCTDEDGNKIPEEEYYDKYDDYCYDYDYEYHSAIFSYNLGDLTTEKIAPTLIKTDYRPLDYRSKIVTHKDKIWYTDCEFKEFDDKGREVLICYAQAVDVSDPANPQLSSRINIPGELESISEDGSRFFTSHRMWSAEAEQEDNYYYGAYVRHLYILKKQVGNDRLSVVRILPISNLREETDDYYMYMDSAYAIQDKAVFIIKNKRTYEYNNNDECRYWYYSNRKNEIDISLFSGADGKKLFDKEYTDGLYARPVAGGGMLVLKGDFSDRYYYREDANEMTFVDIDGDVQDITLPEVTGYNRYGYSNSAVRIGDILHISRGWNGVEAISIK